ncbi:hypothetical protein AB7942_27060 [Neobacillus sp. BF23-41]|uniref:hypothetical protein n=1 Tax=Neobacillus sp. BF23-41 TaxID=3240280 RepID=UPI0034E388CE
MNRWIIGVLIILLVGGSIYMFTNKNDYKEAPYAAGMNFDLEKVEPFLKHLSSTVLDKGFSQDDINSISSEIDKMKHNEVREIGTFDVIYKGKPTKIRIEAEFHSDEDSPPEVVLYMYSHQELVDNIDEEMMKTEEETE